MAQKIPGQEYIPERFGNKKKQDANYLMKCTKKKLKILMNYLPDCNDRVKKHAMLLRHNMTTKDKPPVKIDVEIDLLQGLVLEDRSLPSYKSMKEMSAEFVADNTVDELAAVQEMLKLTTKVRNKYVEQEFLELAHKRRKQWKWDHRHDELD